MTQNTKANKLAAVDFYRMAYMGDPAAAVERYVGTEYIQHNPDVANGKKGFVEYFEKMFRDYPAKDIEFLRVIAEDDMVALHTHQTWPSDEHYVTMDFFRFNEDGKIVEHWDAIQMVPSESKNDNTMY